MPQNFYTSLPDTAFWKTGVEKPSHLAPAGIYTKRWTLDPNAKIAAAGSCFAQHISRNLRRNGYRLMDVEPAPKALGEAYHQAFGYALYSGRYGNIYTTRQLLQLVQEVFARKRPAPVVWEKDARFYDAIRPNIEPDGFASVEELTAARAYHLDQLRTMFLELDVFIFTLGLTEGWEHRETGRVVPIAPGVIAGESEIGAYRFANYGFAEVVADFEAVMALLKAKRKKPTRYLLTVSPVPLTATATGNHVLYATSYSKSVLRAAVGDLYARHDEIDYFPSYEIITNPAARGTFFASNLRSVAPEGVEVVMKEFFANHPPLTDGPSPDAGADGSARKSEKDVQCEEALLEAFGK